jgi:hypothetical protein
LGVTLSFIKDGEHVDCALAFQGSGYESNTGERILERTKQVFAEYSFEIIETRVSFVTDRGSNMIKAYENFTRLNCVDHLLNNILQAAETESPALQEALSKCNRIVTYVKKIGAAYNVNNNRFNLKKIQSF